MIDELPPLPAPALKIQRAYGEEEGFYSDVHMSHYALVVYHMRDAEVADLRAERDALLKDAEHWRNIVPRLLGEIPARDRGDGNAPGHAHQTPGVWDSDNGSLANKPCAWCAVWNEAKATMTSSSKEGK